MSTSRKIVDLTPATVDVVLYRADGWTIPMQFRPGGIPADITGYVITAQIRPTPDSPDSEATNLIVAVTNATEGRFTLSQPIAGVRGVYDVQFVPPGGTKRTYIAGRITVEKDVTKP